MRHALQRLVPAGATRLPLLSRRMERNRLLVELGSAGEVLVCEEGVFALPPGTLPHTMACKKGKKSIC
jgi:hypothetical protein